MATENVNVRVTGVLRQHLQQQIGDDGLYDNASEYIRDLIRRDLLEKQQAVSWLESQVSEGLNAPASAFEAVSADEIIAHAKKKAGLLCSSQ